MKKQSSQGQKQKSAPEQDAPSQEISAEAALGGRYDSSFTIQIVMELQKTVSALNTKIDRLIDDRKSDVGKLDSISSQLTWAKGLLAGALAVLTLSASLFAWLHSDRIKAIIVSPSAPDTPSTLVPLVTTPNQSSPAPQSAPPKQ